MYKCATKHAKTSHVPTRFLHSFVQRKEGYWTAVICYLDCTQWSSCRVLAKCTRGCGFDSQLGNTKDFKNGTWCFLAKRPAFKCQTKEIWLFYPLSMVNCDRVLSECVCYIAFRCSYTISTTSIHCHMTEIMLKVALNHSTHSTVRTLG